MTETSIAWLVYWGAAAVLLVVLWRLCRVFKSTDLKIIILLLAAGLLLTPVPLGGGQSAAWTPGLIAALLESITDGLQAAMQRLWAVLVVMLLLVLGYSCGRYFWIKNRSRKSSPDAS